MATESKKHEKTQHRNQYTEQEIKQLKLPYLKPHSPIEPQGKHVYKTRSLSSTKQFDLRINHCKMPRYDPTTDRNLVFFFQKPRNKRILQRIKEKKVQEKAKEQNKKSRQRLFSHHNTIMMGAGRNKQVSKHQFLTYLEQVRCKIQSVNQ